MPPVLHIPSSVLAQANVEVPWRYLPDWLFGLIAFLSVTLLALLVIYYVRKIFGRRPPIDDELDSRDRRLRSEIYHAKNSVLKELGSRLARTENEIEEIKIDRERKWTLLTQEYHQLDLKLAHLAGRMEALIEKLENR